MIDYLDNTPERTIQIPEPRVNVESIRPTCPNMDVVLGQCMLSGAGCTVESASALGACLESGLLVDL